MAPIKQYPLVRFVADGLRETIKSFITDELPLYRLSWELHTRIESLAEVADGRSLARLRSWQRYVEALDTALRETGREGLTAAEEHTLGEALRALRGTLDELDSAHPSNPPNPTQPAAPRPLPTPRAPISADSGREGMAASA